MPSDAAEVMLVFVPNYAEVTGDRFGVSIPESRGGISGSFLSEWLGGEGCGCGRGTEGLSKMAERWTMDVAMMSLICELLRGVYDDSLAIPDENCCSQWWERLKLSSDCRP